MMKDVRDGIQKVGEGRIRFSAFVQDHASAK